MSTARLGRTFHETFALSLPSISAVLRLSYERNGEISPATIRAQTSLGPNYVKAMPRYARGCGLLEMASYKPTTLGEAIYLRDPNLMNPTTLWLMHYHLSTPQGPGPAFWSHLVTRCLAFGDEISGAEVASQISLFLEGQHAQSLQARSVRSSATVFFGTYTKTDGLGRLRLLHEVVGKDGYVRVSEPQAPPQSAVAYALADYWSAHYGDQWTVGLSELVRDDGFARVMWMDQRRLDEALDALRLEGVLDLYRVAPPFQVARRWSRKEDLLAHLYD